MELASMAGHTGATPSGQTEAAGAGDANPLGGSSQDSPCLATPGLSGQGLNTMSREADARHRLLNLTPTPRWEHVPPAAGRRRCEWGAAYALSPAVDVWAESVRCADPARPARVVGVVGATSAGKSWLIGKLLDDGSAKPSRLEEQFDGVTLQSMTSDINVYADSENDIYYMDFEGTYGTQPLQMEADVHRIAMERCSDVRAWEVKRRQALKESFQPAIAYLTCNVVIFVTREKLVCSRSLEECEHFAQAANGRVVSALPPALVLVQNCCRPSEGLFNPAQCTAAFSQTHPRSETMEWQSYFRTIDCFCIPEEYLVCKRTGFDGEDVCREVVESLRRTVRSRLAEDMAFRWRNQVNLSQLQWFSVVSALCRIVNDSDTVQMASLYMRVGATTGELGELQSVLVPLMARNASNERTSVSDRIQTALGIIARFAVRRELSDEDIDRSVVYLLDLFPCGAAASNEVACFDGSRQPVLCGQMRLFHSLMHRSSALVKTVGADWWQGLSEWFRGGVTHAWLGEFSCHDAFREFDDRARLRSALNEEIEGYKLEKCLEGLAPQVGSPWVVKAHASLHRSGGRLRKDVSQMCLICMAKGVSPGFFNRIWLPSEGGHHPACEHCFAILERHNLCGQPGDVWDQQCAACLRRDGWPGARRPPVERRLADHRLFPCKCSVCIVCVDALVLHDFPACPVCGQPTRWIVDERELITSSWPAAVRREGHSRLAEQPRSSCNTCVGRRR